MGLSVIDNKLEPQQGLIDELELLLEKAKSGDIQAAIYCYQYGDHRISHGWILPNVGRASAIISEMELAKFSLMQMLYDTLEVDGDE